ncbi:MAG: outer membrane lipoprotein-sorting protein [Magnetococcales bacterium]|nr:outer membrane lipoprotein-sorting protein [Magnetococcales bacterium]
MGLFFALFAGGVFHPAQGETLADLTGLAIMQSVSDRQFRPFEFEQLTITRTRGDGTQVVRKGRRYTRLEKGEGGVSRYLLVFDQPEAIKGVAFLIRHLPGGIQGHWVYLPALGQRMHRVFGDGGGGIFDTDFSVEDLANEDYSRFVYQRLADAMHKKRPHFVIEARSAKSKGRWPSHYGSRRIFIDREHYRITRIDYYDRSGVLLKRRTNRSGGTKDAGIGWRPETIRMENLQDKTKTTLQTTRRLYSEEWVPEHYFSRDKIVKGVLMEKKQVKHPQ